MFDATGRVLLLSFPIRTAAQPVSFHVHFTGHTALSFYTNPPPSQVNKYLKTGEARRDTRKFGVYVGQPVRFIPDAANRWTGGGVRMSSDQ